MVPKFYTGNYNLEKDERGFYIILEDLSNHYMMKTDPEGLNFGQVSDILVKIAKFHSTAFVYNMKDQPVHTYESWQLVTTKDSRFIKNMDASFDIFIKDLENEEPNLVKPTLNLKGKSPCN